MRSDSRDDSEGDDGMSYFYVGDEVENLFRVTIDPKQGLDVAPESAGKVRSTSGDQVEALNGILKLIQRNGRGYSFKAIRAKLLYGSTVEGKA